MSSETYNCGMIDLMDNLSNGQSVSSREAPRTFIMGLKLKVWLWRLESKVKLNQNKRKVEGRGEKDSE